MDVIKKTIKQAVTTGTTENNTGNTFVIIPDLNANYHIKISLTSKSLDWGVFDDINESDFKLFKYNNFIINSNNI